MKLRSQTNRIASDESGFALVSVIVIATVIAVLAMGLAAVVRNLAIDSATLVSDAEVRAGTEAGLNRIVLAFSRAGDPLRSALVPDGRPVIWDFAGKTLTLRAQAESGKLDLNAGDREHIWALVDRLAADSAAKTAILGRIDEARAVRMHITSIAAVLAPVDRITAVRDRIEANFTVMTNQRGVDPMTAPALVLETMPLLSDESIRRILGARRDGRSLPLENVRETELRQFVSQRAVYTVRAETASGFGRAGALQAVIGFSAQGEMAIYAWAPAGVSR